MNANAIIDHFEVTGLSKLHGTQQIKKSHYQELSLVASIRCVVHLRKYKQKSSVRRVNKGDGLRLKVCKSLSHECSSLLWCNSSSSSSSVWPVTRLDFFSLHLSLQEQKSVFRLCRTMLLAFLILLGNLPSYVSRKALIERRNINQYS